MMFDYYNTKMQSIKNIKRVLKRQNRGLIMPKNNNSSVHPFINTKAMYPPYLSKDLSISKKIWPFIYQTMKNSVCI